MALVRPTLSELVQSITLDVLNRLDVDDVLRRNNHEVYATVFAGVAHGMYGFIDYMARQQFAHLADEEYLEDHAYFWLREGYKPAGAAFGVVSFTGQANAELPADTLVQMQNGAQYKTRDGVVLSVAGTASVIADAVVAGAVGNVDGALTLSLVSPVLGIDSEAAAPNGFSGGSDKESVESLRTRVLDKQAARPLYGKRGDYIIWAKEVSGVTRAWERYPSSPINQIEVYVMRDDDANPFPDAAEIAVVQAHIDATKPTRADVFVLSPTPKPIDMTIQAYPSTPETRAAIKADLLDLFSQEAAVSGLLYVSHLRQAISGAAGEYDHVLVSPSSNIVCAAGELPVLGDITWV